MKLPSKLTSFEQFLFFDDYPSYPNTIGCHLALSGALSPEFLGLAQELVCKHHPMFRTTLEMVGRKPAWNRCHQQAIVERLPEHFLDRPFVKKIDLHQEAGGQLHWVHHRNRTSLNFLTHHATADGVGGLQVVSDWLAA